MMHNPSVTLGRGRPGGATDSARNLCAVRTEYQNCSWGKCWPNFFSKHAFFCSVSHWKAGSAATHKEIQKPKREVHTGNPKLGWLWARQATWSCWSFWVLGHELPQGRKALFACDGTWRRHWKQGNCVGMHGGMRERSAPASNEGLIKVGQVSE